MSNIKKAVVCSLLAGLQSTSCALFLGFDDKEFTSDELASGSTASLGGDSPRPTGDGGTLTGGVASTGGNSNTGGVAPNTGGEAQGGANSGGQSSEGGSGGVEGSGGEPVLPSYGEHLISCQGLAVRCNDDVAGCCAADLVPGGTTSQGRIANGEDYSPERALTVSDFYLSRFEVTVGRFRMFEQAYADWRSAGHPLEGEGEHPRIAGSGWKTAWSSELPAELPSLVHSCNFDWATRSQGSDEHPMNCVSWYDAFAFCTWDGGRLPTEAEWEFAASGGDLRRNFPWGSTAPVKGVDAVYGCAYSEDCIEKLVVVGSLSRGVSRFGQYEMAGNIGEWVLDGYSTSSYSDPATCVDCARLAPESPADDYRVWRGGVAYNPDPKHLYTFYRFDEQATSRQPATGIRCAYDSFEAE